MDVRLPPVVGGLPWPVGKDGVDDAAGALRVDPDGGDEPSDPPVTDVIRKWPLLREQRAADVKDDGVEPPVRTQLPLNVGGRFSRNDVIASVRSSLRMKAAFQTAT